MKALLILLGILKWLGIILLALLILILLIVAVVMLSPIRYQAAGEKKEALCGSFGVSWLFGAVKADGTYTPEEKLKLKVKVLWMTLMGGEEKPKKKKKPKKAKQQAPKTEKVKPDIQTAEKKEEPKQEPPKEKTQEEKTKIRQQRMEEKQPKTVRRVKLSEIEEKPPAEDTEIVLLDEEEDFFTGGEKEKKEKIPPIVKEIWSIEDKKGVFKAFGKLLKKLMKGILPGDIFVKATVGTGDPTTTGYVLALAGMLTAKFGNDIQVKGDFTKATAEDIEVRVKGKIVLGRLIGAIVVFALTKPVRKAIIKMIKFLKNKDKDGKAEAKGETA
ncbi:MAG: hypothetical protein IKT73_07535 [Anaerotignum sp.]|nr:hypothetical protein [Anaerotignum sp.]